jgi:hypothetical protein
MLSDNAPHHSANNEAVLCRHATTARSNSTDEKTYVSYADQRNSNNVSPLAAGRVVRALGEPIGLSCRLNIE